MAFCVLGLLIVKLVFVFRCGYDQQGLLLNSLVKTDGILGLSRAKVSLPSQLASKGIIKNVVGHCLTANADGGGYMFLGDDYVHIGACLGYLCFTAFQR